MQESVQVCTNARVVAVWYNVRWVTSSCYIHYIVKRLKRLLLNPETIECLSLHNVVSVRQHHFVCHLSLAKKVHAYDAMLPRSKLYILFLPITREIVNSYCWNCLKSSQQTATATLKILRNPRSDIAQPLHRDCTQSWHTT